MRKLARIVGVTLIGLSCAYWVAVFLFAIAISVINNPEAGIGIVVFFGPFVALFLGIWLTYCGDEGGDSSE